ncbi:MAG: hypothetical protein IBJ11_07425 [Phycisphaerales bacterium]|nr:hypothetical protein [Phycisphaerales bacterium]
MRRPRHRARFGRIWGMIAAAAAAASVLSACYRHVIRDESLGGSTRTYTPNTDGKPLFPPDAPGPSDPINRR